MPLTIITAPAGSGKTQYVVEQVRRACAQKQLPRVLLLIPSGLQLVALRGRLGNSPQPTFGVKLTDFHTLYRDILDAAGPLPRLLPESARYRILRHLIRHLAGQGSLGYFGPIADKAGLYNAVASLVAELKENLTLPEEFTRLAATPRTRDLAAIYAAYQHFLQQREIADREGMGWLARDALDADPALYSGYDYVAADGFDQFNPTQLAILHRLAARVPRVDVTLTFQPGRLAHSRFERTLASLAGAPQVPLSGRVPPRVQPLEHLERHLFQVNSLRAPSETAVGVTRAPNREREVRAIGRSIKQLLIHGTRPAQIAVLFRRMADYQSMVREVFSEFGIPFRVRSGMPLSSNPVVSALANLIALSQNDFKWRETIDALRSPYFVHPGLKEESKARIEKITREAIVVQGRQAWLDAFCKPTALRMGEEDRREVLKLSEEQLTELSAWLEAFFKKITPPARTTVPEFVAFVEGLVGQDEEEVNSRPPDSAPGDESGLKVANSRPPDSAPGDISGLGVAKSIRNNDGEIEARDRQALDEFKNVLRGLVQAAGVLGEAEVEWDAFLSDLLDAVNATTYDLEPVLEGRVIVGTVTQARGVPFDYVFLGGLVESEFPPRASEDPLLTAAERETLRQAGVVLADPLLRDETTLFYEAATLARRRLFLSYPYLDDDANDLYPSPYLESVRAVLDDVPTESFPISSVPLPEQAASFGELAVALIRAPAADLESALFENSSAWRHSLYARQVEAARQSPDTCDAYGGVIVDPDLCAEFARKFGPGHSWSASQFNEWGGCGFKFFAHRLLKLEEMADPEEGLDVLALGNLSHAILEKTYSKLAEFHIPVTTQTLDQASGILHESAAPLLASAPQDLGFRPTAWWQQEQAEILRRLDAFLISEAERNEKNPASPFKFEVHFGLEAGPPVSIKLPAGKIRVSGVIDRLDQCKDGVIVIDYKTGGSPIGIQEVIQGRDLQLPVYSLAAEALGYHVSNAYFLHIKSGKKSGEVKADREAWLEAAKTHMSEYVNRARAGDFSVVPRDYAAGACNAHCDFSSLCRVGRWSANKGKQEANA